MINFYKSQWLYEKVQRQALYFLIVSRCHSWGWTWKCCSNHIDNASVMKLVGSIVEAEHLSIFWWPCVVHTLNINLKNICASKNSFYNEYTYNACQWIVKVVDEPSFILVYIMNHSMRLVIFN